ncbi:MAG: BatD family protein [Candidatus Binatia bacterium]
MASTRTAAAGAIFALLLVLGVHASPAAEPVSVSASVNARQVAVGEPFLLSIAIEGAQNAPVPVVEPNSFQVQYAGPSTEVSFVNGKISARVTHRFRLVGERQGEFTLGPFAVEVGGERYETVPIAMRVGPAAGPRQHPQLAGNPQSMWMVVQPARSEIYVGERVEVGVTLYAGDVRVRDVEFPVIHAEGVTVDKFPEPDQGSEVINGRRYTALRMRTTLTPIQPGTIELHTTMAMTAMTQSASLFDQFFGGDWQKLEVVAKPVQLDVLPLPEEGQPKDFSGAVGRFTFTLSAQPTELEAGDPITLRTEIAGVGNLAAVTAPAVPADDRFRRYDPQPVRGEDGADRRVFEQVVIPKSADVREIPALRFTFFDPEQRAYQVIERGPTPIEVRPGAAGKAQVLDAQPELPPRAEADAPLGRDLVYIKDAPGTFQRGERWYRGGWLAAAVAAPPLGFLAVVGFARRRARIAADPRLARRRAAAREARRALAAMRAASTGSERFYDDLSSAVATYLAARLDLPPGAVERDTVIARLSQNGTAEALCERTRRFFALIEQARYAGGNTSTGRDAALALALEIVDGLERARGLSRNLGRLAVGVALATALGARAYAEAPPEAEFFAGNQAYADGRYADAVRAYEAVRDAGWESGALFFNLGNAYMKNGELGRGLANYERAARLLPRDPDVAANLSFAREQAQLEEPAAPLWRRIIAPLAARATGAELASAFLIAWLALWAALALRYAVGRRRGGALGYVAAAASVLALAIGLSFGRRMVEIESASRAVVIANEDLPARFEPSATGTEHFIVTPGAGVDVLETRNGWLQVRRADGRRGWLPADAVELLD